MSRMKNNALTTLVESAEAGTFTLPADVLDACRTYTRVRAVELTELEPLHAETAAARLVSAVAAGEGPDLATLAGEVQRSVTNENVAYQAKGILGEAIEQTGTSATYLAADATERIITDHLRPALEEVHAEAKKVVDALGGHALDTHSLLSSPPKVRAAYLSLPSLVSRRLGILNARHLANTLGDRELAHDTQGLYADFANPLAFSPGWKPPARVAPIPWPEDTTAALLWIVSDEVAAAKPWLPTVAEQDAAFWEQFGKDQEMRATMAVAARAYAGQQV